MIKYINEDGFSKEVLMNENLVIVDFYANWCGPCMKLGNELEKISKSRSVCQIVKVDVDKSANLVRKYGIDTIPVIMLFKNGKLLDKSVGYLTENEILNMVDKYEYD